MHCSNCKSATALHQVLSATQGIMFVYVVFFPFFYKFSVHSYLIVRVHNLHSSIDSLPFSDQVHIEFQIQFKILVLHLHQIIQNAQHSSPTSTGQKVVRLVNDSRFYNN